MTNNWHIWRAYLHYTAAVMKGNPMERIDFEQYQTGCMLTAVYPDVSQNMIYPLLELAGETGEIALKLLPAFAKGDQGDFLANVVRLLHQVGSVCEILKKVMRDQDGVFDMDSNDDLTNNCFRAVRNLSALTKDLTTDAPTVMTPIWQRMEISQGAALGIGREIGDCLYALAQMCTELRLSLHNVAAFNAEKLNDRFERGVIQGSGDTR